MDALIIHNAASAVCPIDGVGGPIPSGGYQAADGSHWLVDVKPSATGPQVAALVAAIGAVNPSAVTVGGDSLTINYLQFEALFTPTEQLAIFTAAAGSPSLMQWLFRAAGANSIDLSNPETLAGIDALASAGLLTSLRAAAVKAGTAPT